MTRPKSSSKQVKLVKRVVSTKRHTVGYRASNGKFLTVAQARQMASSGRVDGVRTVGGHVQADTGRKPLYKLPQIIER